MKFVGTLARAACRQVQFQARRNGGHEAPFNPGPPTTWDYSPVPCQPYPVVYKELQNKFNRYLAIGATAFVLSFSLALADDVFAKATFSKPNSYKNNEPVLTLS